MSAAEALKAARAAGVSVGIDGDDLALEASTPPPWAVLDALSRHKSDIVALLRPENERWSAEDWQAFFDERAGIIEFDGGLPRPQAEAQALECSVIKWLNRNPVQSSPGRCLECGASDRQDDPLLPFGAEPGTHAWLHAECWPAWHQARQADAIAALSAMGIRR
jgi:hypothetical protein